MSTGITQQEKRIVEKMGDGGDAPANDKTLLWLKDELERCWNDGADGVFERRRASENTRYAIWAGQSPDGRKHAKANNDKDVFPFEDASDARVRLADELVNERVALLVTSAMRGELKVSGTESSDAGMAGKVQIIMRWVMRNQWGANYRRWLIRLAQYQEGDAPAVGLMGVYWHEETALESKEVTVQQFAGAVAKVAGGIRNEEELADLVDLIKNPERANQAEAILMALVPAIKPRRAAIMIRELREAGKTKFPQKYTRIRMPILCPYRYLDDVFYRSNTGDLQQTPVIYVRTWMTRAALEEKMAEQGWSKSFVDKVLKHEGESGFPEVWWSSSVRADVGLDGCRSAMKDDHLGEYEVLTAYFRETDDDGVPGIFTVPFHFGVMDEAATDVRLLTYAHGKYPFVDFPREILTKRQLDSRGIPEVVMTQQAALKLHNDLQDDSAQINAIPPIMVPHNRPNTPLLLKPMAQIRQRRPGEYSWFPPAPTPVGSDHRVQQIRAQVDRYCARANPDDPNDMVMVQRQLMVDTFLDNLADALTMVFQLIQQYMPDEELGRITGVGGVQVARGRGEIQGKFDFRLSADVRDMDPGFVKAEAEMIAKIIQPLDRQATIEYDRIVRYLMRKISPEAADELLQPAQQANEREVRDEMQNFALLSAGIMPPMLDAGQNFPLRLQVIQGIIQGQPDAIQAMEPFKQEKLKKWLEYRTFMVQQQKNAQTGRVGVEQ